MLNYVKGHGLRIKKTKWLCTDAWTPDNHGFPSSINRALLDAVDEGLIERDAIRKVIIKVKDAKKINNT